MFIQQNGEPPSNGCSGSWGNGARAKSVNHSISKINGMFWSSLPFVSGEWPVQRQAQQAGAKVSAVVDGYRRIMKQRPGVWLRSVPPTVLLGEGQLPNMTISPSNVKLLLYARHDLALRECLV